MGWLEVLVIALSIACILEAYIIVKFVLLYKELNNVAKKLEKALGDSLAKLRAVKIDG